MIANRKIVWLWNRLRCMSFPEVIHRFKVRIQTQLEKTGFFLADMPPPSVSQKQLLSWSSADIFSQVYTREKIENLLAGKMQIFALSDYQLTPHHWNQDPKTKTTAPLSFGKTLNYRDENLVGDIKYLWEPSRHIQLVLFAQAYASTKDEQYSNKFRNHLSSWFQQCPYMKGPQWVSSLELGIRLINWSFAWQLLGGYKASCFQGKIGNTFRDQWLESIYQHVHFIQGHYSRFTSANNHLIGEASGVYVASQNWPYWDDFESWGSRAQTILEEQAQEQNYADGVNKEQAVSYQQFVLDFLIIPVLVNGHSKQLFSDQYLSTIENMLEYLAAVMDVNGNIPMIGDADDGYVVILDHSKNFCPFQSLLATGAVLFKRSDFKAKTTHFDNKSFSLLGSEGVRCYDELTCSDTASPIKSAFPKGGYYILSLDYNTPTEVKLLVDSGSLGYGGIAAHGHADALSIYLSVAGQEIFVDPGTYAYHTQSKWRNYFRGTSAHNTLRINQIDQSEIGGNFMWLRKAETRCEEYEDSDKKSFFLGTHNGYNTGKHPMTVKREIILNKQTLQIIITDTVISNMTIPKVTKRYDFKNDMHGANINSDTYTVEQFWHLSENAKIIARGLDTFQISNQSSQVTITIDQQLKPEVIMGDEKRPLGWVSRKFDLKVPSNTIVCNGVFSGDCCFKTVINIHR